MRGFKEMILPINAKVFLYGLRKMVVHMDGYNRTWINLTNLSEALVYELLFLIIILIIFDIWSYLFIKKSKIRFKVNTLSAKKILIIKKFKAANSIYFFGLSTGNRKSKTISSDTNLDFYVSEISTTFTIAKRINITI